jgi:hypothetical protein
MSMKNSSDTMGKIFYHRQISKNACNHDGILQNAPCMVTSARLQYYKNPPYFENKMITVQDFLQKSPCMCIYKASWNL